MKLTLERFRDLSILTATGPINPQNFAILRAGIKKLFADGKNRIILELPEADQVPPDILRELANLNLMAAELSGQIVLARIEPLIRIKIESFAAPPVARCFFTREDAILFFHPGLREDPEALAQLRAELLPPSEKATAQAIPESKKKPTSPENPAAAPAPSAAAPEPTQTESSLPQAQSSLAQPTVAVAAPASAGLTHEEIRSREIGDLNGARNRISQLENENASLREQLVKLVIKRREAPDLDAAQGRISSLQKQVDDLIQQLNEAAPKKSETPPKTG